MLDWIYEIEKYFEYEIIPEDKKVRIEATNLKGHAISLVRTFAN